MKPDITVIVPIYNTEIYLDKCLLSIRNQTYQNIEIICIDDCSPDESSLIVQKHMSEDPRVKLIKHEQNKGLGGARNTGILAAKAEYIASVDSDDTILPDMIKKLWDGTENGKFDVVSCNYNSVDAAGRIISKYEYSPRIMENTNNSIDIFLVINPAFWNKIWRRSLFVNNGIFFPEHLYFEDMATTPRILTKAKNIKLLEDCLYNYLQRDGAITSTFTAKHILDHFMAYEIIYKHLDKNHLLNRYKTLFLNYIDSGMRYHTKCVTSSTMDSSEVDQYLRLLLLNKVSFIKNYKHLNSKNQKQLAYLLGSAHSGNDIRIPKILFKLKKRVRELLGLINFIKLK